VPVGPAFLIGNFLADPHASPPATSLPKQKPSALLHRLCELAGRTEQAADMALERHCLGRIAAMPEGVPVPGLAA
jgi:hypothetical protein